MLYRALLGIFSVFVIIGLTAHADEITVRGQEKVTKGTIKTEDAKSVVVSVVDGKKKADETIASADIVDISYESISPISLTVKGSPFRAAKDAEKDVDSEDAVKRKAALATAVAGYTETLKTIKRESPGQKLAARHVEFKVAFLMAAQANDQVSSDRAVKKLQEFKTNNPSSWQINQVMPLIAQLQADAKDYKDAEKTYQEMAEMEALSADIRRDAELKIVGLAMQAGNIELANKRLDALEKKAAASPALASRVKMARAEVLVGQKEFDKAIPLLQEVVKTNKDEKTKALAHNTLGECLFKAGKHQEALWEFLWVDAVFNQDKNQHAKALYYLWKTFEQLNDAPRAQECREMLIEGPQFRGTEFQREAMKAK